MFTVLVVVLDLSIIRAMDDGNVDETERGGVC